MYAKSAAVSPEVRGELMRVARGDQPADLVFKNFEFLDVFGGGFLKGDVAVHKGVICGVGSSYEGNSIVDGDGCFLVPGFIDTHIHVESSLMTPARYQQAILPRGTTTIIWDPHEIANVKGVEGIKWALEASENLALDVFVMVPSCVPSTSPGLSFETSGADLRSKDLEPFISHPRVLGLAEMMNFPGVLGEDEDVHTKLTAFSHLLRDGHCPGLVGKDLDAYALCGIHSCHESVSIAEAREKLSKGIHVLIREGSCAKDAATLLPLMNPYTSSVLALCSDDRNPLDIRAEGHIDYIVNMALKQGVAPWVIFRAASYSGAKMYGLNDRGAVAPGYKADLNVIVPQSGGFEAGIRIESVYKSGKRVELTDACPATPVFQGKNLHLNQVTSEAFKIESPHSTVRVIGVKHRQIVTDHLTANVPVRDGLLCPDLENDILKISVLCRYPSSEARSVGFVKGFGLKTGAIATSINHDSHNVIVVGADEGAMARAVNALLHIDGGIVVVGAAEEPLATLPLPIGGLMTDAPAEQVADRLILLKQAARDLGCRLEEPFLALSFLALPVIPKLKITDQGLVDVEAFKLVEVTAGTI